MVVARQHEGHRCTALLHGALHKPAVAAVAESVEVLVQVSKGRKVQGGQEVRGEEEEAGWAAKAFGPSPIVWARAAQRVVGGQKLPLVAPLAASEQLPEAAARCVRKRSIGDDRVRIQDDDLNQTAQRDFLRQACEKLPEVTPTLGRRKETVDVVLMR